MGHAHHFLSRLDRVSLPHVELALSLYRDDALLRFVLERARLPDGAERVAISLDDPDTGPFLVVTREGRFVTCLGAGMRADDLPVVTRGQLDGITAKHEDYRARVRVREAFEERGGVKRLMRRIFDAGPELSREEFIAISSLQPIMGPEFFHLCLTIAADAERTRHELRLVLKRTEFLRPTWHPVLESFWKQFWATGHFAVLAAMGGNAIFEGIKGPNGVPVAAGLSLATMKDGIVVQSLRGAWAVARLGKALLPHYKERLAAATNRLDLFEAAIPLLALGLRHAKLRAEVRKLLVPPPRFPQRPYLDRPATGISELSQMVLDEPEKMENLQFVNGAELAILDTWNVPYGTPFGFREIGDVPMDLARSIATTCRGDYLHDNNDAVSLLAALPWVARAAPEQLYLPEDYLKAVHRPWTPDETIRLLNGWIDDLKERPAKPEGPARKGPCPCGSGKKYKRCCGE